jgi:hypothetical protein
MQIPPRRDDPIAVMAAVPSVLPSILRESLDTGFFRYVQGRALNPAAYARYSLCTKNNIIYDEVSDVLRELVDLASPACPGLHWRPTPNKRATEVFVDPFLALRVKRVKSNRGGLSTGVKTKRNRSILRGPRSSVGQITLPFHEVVSLADLERIWLTVTWDMDAIEESMQSQAVGVESVKQFLWREPLVEGDADVIASISPALADRMSELQEARSA